MLPVAARPRQANQFYFRNILISPGLQRGVRSTRIVAPNLKAAAFNSKNYDNLENNYQRQLGE
jgi:hypothetical protein